jgi:hypothetical protein
MDHRVKGLSSALAICLAAAGSAASAQSSSWRVANYGSEFSTAGIAPQALALDASNDPYAFAFVANGAESAIRLSHYHGANGSIIWQRDVALPEAPWFPFSTFNSGQPTAALASIGTDAVLAATNYDTQFYGRIARYAGGNGDLVWEKRRTCAHCRGVRSGCGRCGGNVIAAGAAGDIYVSATKGHVAKFHAGDGSLAWSVDLDAAACGAGSSLWFQFTTVSVDDNGDVFAGGFFPIRTRVSVLRVQTGGTDGSVKWTYAYLPHGASFVRVAVDGGGDPVFASGPIPVTAWLSSRWTVRPEQSSGPVIPSRLSHRALACSPSRWLQTAMLSFRQQARARMHLQTATCFGRRTQQRVAFRPSTRPATSSSSVTTGPTARSICCACFASCCPFREKNR